MDIKETKTNIKRFLLDLEKNRVSQVIAEYEYLNLSDVIIYSNTGDSEALSILSWYKAYDDAIWDWIENELEKYTEEELVKVDPIEVEHTLFDGLKHLLPQEE
jgi:tRNA(Ile2) C34 agmatinyltransferase TiaS